MDTIIPIVLFALMIGAIAFRWLLHWSDQRYYRDYLAPDAQRAAMEADAWRHGEYPRDGVFRTIDLAKHPLPDPTPPPPGPPAAESKSKSRP